METLKVNERRDDTTKPEAESRPARGSYYYDDATGYETYEPEEADGDEADEAPGEENARPRGGE